MCEYGGFQTAARQRTGGRLGLRRVWANERIGGTRMSSRDRKSRLRLALSRGVVGGEVKCTERALQDVTNCRFAQPASSATEECTQQAVMLSRVWVRSSWIGRAQTVRMLYIASHDAVRKAQCRNLFLGGSFDACCSFSSLQSVHSPYRPSVLRQLPMYCLP